MMRLRKISSLGVLAIVGLLGSFSTQAPAQDGNLQNGNLQEELLRVFHPYRQGGPQVEGITPGTKRSAKITTR